MSKNIKYLLVKKGGSLYRSHFEPSAFKGTHSMIDKIGSRVTAPIFHKATFSLVGALGYKRGSNPVLGSLAYTILHTLIGKLFNFVFIVGGLGVGVLSCVWEMLKFVLPILGKITKDLILPILGTLFNVVLKDFCGGILKIITGIIGFVL